LDSGITDILENLPDTPGVYIMKDDKGSVIYIGKAISLKKRVKQYFQNSRALDAKTSAMVVQVHDIEHIIAANELEALILECNLIKSHRPKYNILLKDDKHYPYIRVTMEEDYPRVLLARDMKKDGSRYFGPYKSSHAVKQTIDAINRLFAVRTCSRNLSGSATGNRPCLNYHIGRCMAPCQGSIEKDRYRDMIRQICLFLGNRHGQLIKLLEQEMERASDSLDFEKAARLRDQVSVIRSIAEKQRVVATDMVDQDVIAHAIKDDNACIQVFFVRNGKLLESQHYFVQDIGGIDPRSLMAEFLKRFYSAAAFVPGEILLQDEVDEASIIERWLAQKRGSSVKIRVPQKGDKKKLVEMASDNATELLENFSHKLSKEKDEAYQAMDQLYSLLNLDEYPFRIEAFDISNIQGMEPVASMVVFEEARPKKNDYRRYRIKDVYGPDDYDSIREVIRRRYRRSSDDDPGILPQLVMVDGGRGQVSAAMEVLDELGLSLQVCGMVKDERHRTRGIIKDGQEYPLASFKDAYRLVASIQEEAHRFAITYHRSLRRNKQVRSVLDQIPGVGQKRRRALLKHFGSIDAIRSADIDQLARVEGMNLRVARSVHEFFNKP
jgi:excinuclease ABC subunit C